MSAKKSQNETEDAQITRSALPVGTILHSPKHEYKVTKVLGAGGFGITYKVSSLINVGNATTKMFFVIKELFLKGCDRGNDGKTVTCSNNMRKEYEESLADFITEAERLNRLGIISPNIVKINEHFTANDTAYYVMEYLDGCDLDKLVKREGPLSEARALSIIVPIAEAVGILHQNKLLHLDIKPENIVLKSNVTTGKTTPVLIDFGLAKHFDNKGNPTTSPLANGFTSGYAPIEQYAEITTFATEIDVYALGATLYFLLTGKNPPKAFYIKSSEELMQSLPSGISPKTHSTLVGAMQPSPPLRTKDVKTFLSLLQKSISLPIGAVLHGKNNYKIVEVIGQLDNYIHYRAVKIPKHKGYSEGIPTLKKYDVYEWYVKDKDSRLFDGLTVEKQSWRPIRQQSTRGISSIENKWINFVKNISKNESNSEFFEANNTSYYVCEVYHESSQPTGSGNNVRPSHKVVPNKSIGKSTHSNRSNESSKIRQAPSSENVIEDDSEEEEEKRNVYGCYYIIIISIIFIVVGISSLIRSCNSDTTSNVSDEQQYTPIGAEADEGNDNYINTYFKVYNPSTKLWGVVRVRHKKDESADLKNSYVQVVLETKYDSLRIDDLTDDNIFGFSKGKAYGENGYVNLKEHDSIENSRNKIIQDIMLENVPKQE